MRIYPMSPIMALANYHAVPFTMTLVKNVERLGRDVVEALRLEVGK